MQINAPVPDFSLPDSSGKLHRLSETLGRIVVVNFWSAECPWSERADQELLEFQEQSAGKVVLLAIASNSNESDDLIAEVSRKRGLELVLRDNGCQLADAWGAITTPHVFIIDQAGILRYQGALDDVTFRKRKPEHHYVDMALKALLAGQLPEIQETPPYGCTILRPL